MIFESLTLKHILLDGITYLNKFELFSNLNNKKEQSDYFLNGSFKEKYISFVKILNYYKISHVLIFRK